MNPFRNDKSNLRVFLAMLASLGGSLPEVRPSSGEERRKHTGGKVPAPQYELGEHGRVQYRERHGTIYRVYPKRDRSMSARQWRIYVKRSRREAKAREASVAAS